MSNHSPLVSIGIPTYNRPLGLRRILKDITDQTYTNLEIIISDNHSPESETEQIAHEFMQRDSRIRYVRQANNIGIFNNYQFLLQQAQGEYFTWVSDDDFRDPEYITACIEAFDRLKTPVLVNSYSVRMDRQSGQKLAIDQGCNTLGLSARDRYIKYISTIFTTQAAVGDIIYGIMKREALLNAVQNQPNIIGWDHLPLAYLALQGEFYTVPRELMGSSNAGASSTIEKTAKSQLIEGSLSEQMPTWVKETYLQKIIWQAATLNPIEKLYLSAWSYSFYWLTHGLKMWIKGLSPSLFNFVKNTLIRYA
jgi:glycosyltransferase involved in cell wall biosynthesis